MVLRFPLTSSNAANLLFPLRVLSWRVEPWSSPRCLHAGHPAVSPPPQDIPQQHTGIAASDQYLKSWRRDWMSSLPRVLQQLVRWLCAVITELLCDTSVSCQPVTCCHSQPLKLNQKNITRQWHVLDTRRNRSLGKERGWDFWRKERKLSFKMTLLRRKLELFKQCNTCTAAESWELILPDYSKLSSSWSVLIRDGSVVQNTPEWGFELQHLHHRRTYLEGQHYRKILRVK